MSLVKNLYVHFPFCRRKCSYCALYSRAGAGESERNAYASELAEFCRCSPEFSEWIVPGTLKSVYFGGGSPALCKLGPMFDALAPFLSPDCEFTVELHPLDVSERFMDEIGAGGVNRISMGVQSLCDDVLADMGRGYGRADARRAFAVVRSHFDNAGIDLIAGYPGAGSPQREADSLLELSEWGLTHLSLYSLIRESKTLLDRRLREGKLVLPDDDAVMDAISLMGQRLRTFGLERYEISNYALPGFECRHNLSVWRGEDYVGLGSGAHGRVGLKRTVNFGPFESPPPEIETVSPTLDVLERRLFRLRTKEGIDPSGYPSWSPILDRFESEGLLSSRDGVYFLTSRGAEVCDSILSELMPIDGAHL